MSSEKVLRRTSMILAALAGAQFAFAPAHAQYSPTYSAEQSVAGKVEYDKSCATCHGADLDNGPFGPVLRGDEFLTRWGGKSVQSVMDYVTDMMPPASPGSLTAEQATNLVAYMLSKNAVPAGAALQTASSAEMTMPVSVEVRALAGGVRLPANPVARANPLDKIRPVTDAMLAAPPAGSWLNWRRTPDGEGYSPLKQINKKNVKTLKLAWSLTMAPGPNQVEPLVHDGVLFAQGFKDVVQAIDAQTGDQLWQYVYRLPSDVTPTPKKSLALYDNLLIMATSDAHLVALNVRTGNVVWNTALGAKPFTILGGPIIANGKVVVGTARGPKPFIAAVDAKTGKEAWRFNTIPKPGEPGGDTWNGVPWEKRSGGTIWTAGTYDPKTNLVFFGPAPTYDTGPLRNLVPGGNNDALYTNATVALNADTGKLAWYFQHVPNDQWDLDWAFERQIITVGKGAKARRIVVTAGKPAIHDALDPATGKYLFSYDPGLQNIVTRIDPKTGVKTINQDVIPGDGKTKTVCPVASGAKNFTASGYNPNSQVLFVPMLEACMDYVPVGPGERGLLSTGVRQVIRPRPDSDGLYSRLEAIDLNTLKPIWTTRERMPIMTATLPTAGGVVFAGAVDRSFSAYDDATGKRLWTTRLNDIPNSNPISYEIAGKQYIAIVTGGGSPRTTCCGALLPELKNPTVRSSSIYVFELP